MQRSLMQLTRGLWLLLAVLLLTGCREAPDQAALDAVIQSRLTQAFGPQTFAIERLRRLGSGPLAADAQGRARQIVYFNAVLGLERDLDFSSWDTLNIAAFASLLGATPLGVSGLDQAGNRRGDRVYVHGSASFVRDAAAAGVDLKGLAAVREGGLEQGLADLAAGRVDAVIATISAPAARIQAAAALGLIRLLPIAPDLQHALAGQAAGLVPIQLPPDTYPGQVEAVPTLAATALLVAAERLPRADVDLVLGALFGGIDFVAAGSAAGSQINRRSAAVGLTLPLHPAAEVFFAGAVSPVD